MGQVKTDKVAEQEALVTEYIEDSADILEDPESGEASLCKVADVGSNLLLSVSNETVEAMNRTTEAVHLLNAASKDPHCSPGEVRSREKEVKRLEAEHEGLKAICTRLDFFMNQVKIELHNYLEGSGEPESEGLSQPESPERLEIPEKVSWWRRLFG